MTTAVMEQLRDPTANADQMAMINAKLDALSKNVQALGDQVQYLAEKAHGDQSRRQEWDDLKSDMTPIVQGVYAVTVEQLEEIQNYVQLEDILNLLKRLARNTRTFNEMLGQLESMRDLWKDLSPLSKEVFDQATATLGELEQKGYFGFVRQSQYVMDQIVTSFSEEDVRLLGDNIVLILNTMKALTQPEMMNLINNLTEGFHEVEEHADELPTSLMGLLGQMRDPDVRRGLAVTMAILKRVSQQHPQIGTSTKTVLNADRATVDR